MTGSSGTQRRSETCEAEGRVRGEDVNERWKVTVSGVWRAYQQSIGAEAACETGDGVAVETVQLHCQCGLTECAVWCALVACSAPRQSSCVG